MSKSPNDWQPTLIGELASSLRNGFCYKETDQDPLPITRIETISGGNIDFRKVGNAEFDKRLSEFKLERGDILFSHINSLSHLGKVAIKECDRLLFHGMNLLRIRPNTEKILPKYFYYLLSGEQIKQEIGRLAKSAINQASLNLSDVKNICAFLPPINQQRKIANILSTVDDVVDLTETEIEKLRCLKKGMTQDLLTKGVGHTKFKDSPVGRIPESWGIKPLGELFSFKNGLNADGKNYGRGIKFINISEIFKRSSLRHSDIPGMVDIPDNLIETFLVKHGDLLLNRTSETVEEIAFVSVYLDTKPVIFGGFVIRGRPNSEALTPEYCRYCFEAHYFRSEVMKQCQGAIRANIGQEGLRKIVMPIPPVEEQQQIAANLSEIETAIDTKARKVASLVNLKRGLMHDLLNGRVRVTV